MAEEPERPESTRGGGVSEQRTPRRTKKTYVPPGLVEYGSIAKLTQTASTSRADAGTMRKSCL